MQQDQTLALANLATNSQSDRTLVAVLTKTISKLLIQAAHITAKLVTAQAENARLENWDIVQPWPSTAIRRPEIIPFQIQTQAKNEMCTPRAEKNRPLRVLLLPQLQTGGSTHVRDMLLTKEWSQTSWLSDCTSKEDRLGISSRSTADLTIEEKQDYIKI